jgi:hypothetical protein
MTILDSIRNILAPVRAGIESLSRGAAELLDRRAARLAERTALAAAPAPVDECAAAARARVQEVRAPWLATHGPAAVQALSGGVERAPDGTWVRRPGRVPDQLSGILTGGVVTWEQLYVLCPDIVAAGLAALARDVPYQAGAPMAERLAPLAQLDAEIAGIEREHTALVDEAAREGVHLELLDDERARRALAAAAERRAEREAAVREMDQRLKGQR